MILFLMINTDLEIPTITTNKSILVEKDSVILTCLTNAIPSNTFQWKSQGKIVAETPQLLLQNLNKHSNATYECVVQNIVGMKSTIYILSVQCKFKEIVSKENKFFN